MSTTSTTDVRRGATSASAAEADHLCPGRFQAQVGLPEVASEAAESGTRIHQSLAGIEVKLSDEEQQIADACREVEKKLVLQVFGLDAKPTAWSEQRYWCRFKHTIAGKETILEHSGQADKAYRYKTQALVIDYKTGPAEQKESSRNLQLRDLAVLLSGHLLVPTVYTVVVQPLVTMTPEICIYNQGDLQQAKTNMYARIAASRQPDAPRVAGQIQCRYCRATKVCAEYQKWVTGFLPAERSIVGVPIDHWSAEQCAVFCAGRAAAQRWLEDAEEAMKARLKASPDAIPGWCLKDGKNRRLVNNPSELFNRFRATGGNQDQFLKAIKVVVEDFKESLKEVTGLKGKPLDIKVNALLEGIVDVRQDKPSLAKKRE